MSRSVCKLHEAGLPRSSSQVDRLLEDDAAAQAVGEHVNALARDGIIDIRYVREFDSDSRCANRTRNTRDQRSRRIRQVWPPCAKQRLTALHVICTSERPKLSLAKGRSAQR